MIYETYTAGLKPGAISEVLRRTAERLDARVAVSPLAAWWYAEIGALNHIVQVWPYRDLAHRDEVQGRLRSDPGAAIDLSDLLESERVELWTPAPFMRPLTPSVMDGVFEMRTYTFKPGSMPDVLEVWGGAIEVRETLSPLVACWYPVTGELNRLQHIWVFTDLAERARIRAEAMNLPSWPPLTREWRIAEESSLLLPAPFSPIR